MPDRSPTNPTAPARPAPPRPAPPRADQSDEHAAVAAQVAALAARAVQYDAVDPLELGDLDGAEQLSQAAREAALGADDLAGLALATATLAAVRTLQDRPVEAQAMWMDAERFLAHAPTSAAASADDPRPALTRRLLEILAGA